MKNLQKLILITMILNSAVFFNYGMHNPNAFIERFNQKLQFEELKKAIEELKALGANLSDADQTRLTQELRQLSIDLNNPKSKEKVNVPLEKMLVNAIKNGNKDFVYTLIEAGSDVNWLDEMGDTPLHHAVYDSSSRNSYTIDENRLKMVKMLIYAGVDVNQPNHEGYTPLMIVQFFRDNGNAEYAEVEAIMLEPIFETETETI